MENCTNTLILRCSASEQGGTSQFASRLIGQRGVIYQTHSTTSQPGQWLSSHTTSDHRTVEHAIMTSEIKRLADIKGYLKLASYPDWYRVALSRVVSAQAAGGARSDYKTQSIRLRITTPMERNYLYVPPEKYVEVQAAGAAWDAAGKRWCVPEGAAAYFTRWLGGDADEAEFGVSRRNTKACSDGVWGWGRETSALSDSIQEIECLHRRRDQGFASRWEASAEDRAYVRHFDLCLGDRPTCRE